MKGALLVVLGASCVAGCATGPSVLEVHAVSALAARDVLDTARDITEAKMRNEAVLAASNQEISTEEAEILAHQAIRSYDKLVVLYDRCLAAYKVWTAALALAAQGEKVTTLRSWDSLAQAFMRAYKEMTIESLKRGIDPPSIDAIVKSILHKEDLQ